MPELRGWSWKSGKRRINRLTRRDNGHSALISHSGSARAFDRLRVIGALVSWLLCNCAAARGLLDRRAARVREAEKLSDLVERLPRRVVAGAAEQFE